MCIQSSHHHLSKRLSSPYCVFLAPLSTMTWLQMHGGISGLCFVLLVSTCLYTTTLFFDYCSFIRYFEIRKCDSFSSYMKRYPASLLIREMQMKTTGSCHLTPVRMTRTKKLKGKHWRGRAEIRTLYTVGWNEKWCSYWKTGGSSQNSHWFSNPTSACTAKGTEIRIWKWY